MGQTACKSNSNPSNPSSFNNNATVAFQIEAEISDWLQLKIWQAERRWQQLKTGCFKRQLHRRLWFHCSERVLGSCRNSFDRNRWPSIHWGSSSAISTFLKSNVQSSSVITGASDSICCPGKWQGSYHKEACGECWQRLSCNRKNSGHNRCHNSDNTIWGIRWAMKNTRCDLQVIYFVDSSTTKYTEIGCRLTHFNSKFMWRIEAISSLRMSA